MLYGTPGTVLTRACLGDRAGAMRDSGHGLPRMPLPRTWVNKGKKKGRGTITPRPAEDLSCGLGETDYGLLGGIAHLRVGA